MRNKDAYIVSVVVPVFNESEVIVSCLSALQDTLNSTNYDYEIIVVDDGSTDSTSQKVEQAALGDSKIVTIQLSRNFGKESALAAGLESSRGDSVIFLDADLQHPPRLIPEMLAKWEEGFDIVNAKKVHRGRESTIYRGAALLFNLGMSRAVGSQFSGASDYKLIDRQVVEALKCCPERNRFFRGLVSWVGFKSVDIDFDVENRVGGSTKWSRLSLLKYSLSNFIAFSSLPLRLVAYAGFITTGIGLVLLFQTLYNYLTGQAVTGFTTVIAVQVLIGGMILVALGVIAIYLGKMYQEQKARPIFIVRERKSDRKRFD